MKRTHARTRFDAPPRHPREAAEERIVAQLAERMRAKLAQRRHLEELRLAFFGCCDPEDIIAEAVDVAAYAAILVDVLSMEAQ